MSKPRLEISVLGQFVFYMEKNEVGTLHHTTCRNQFLVMKHINMSSKTIKLWEDHIGEHLYILGIGKDFLIKTQKSLSITANIDILTTLKSRTLAYQKTP